MKITSSGTINFKRMNFAVFCISITTICVIPNTYSIPPPSPPPPPVLKVPGCSSCLYFGALQEYCNMTSVPVDQLPPECTSLLFSDISSDDQFNIADGSGIDGNAEYLKKLLDEGGKPVFVFYGHSSITEWAAALDGNVDNDGANAKTEMENLKTYLEQYPGITGLIIECISLDPTNITTNFPNFNANFKVYIDTMRATFPDYGIGLELKGNEVMNYYETNCTLEWMDFTILDPVIDFYVHNVYSFNPCTADFQFGGTSPVNGNATNTLEKLVTYTVNAGIPKNKTYFEFRLGPRQIGSDEYGDICAQTNSEYCIEKNVSSWCSDDSKTYTDKGVFAQANGVGFIGMNVDLDDPDGTGCLCDPYPAFYDILDGFTGETNLTPCRTLDKKSLLPGTGTDDDGVDVTDV